MINETILAIIIAFAVSAILCPIVIPFLHKLKFGQQVREEMCIRDRDNQLVTQDTVDSLVTKE